MTHAKKRTRAHRKGTKSIPPPGWWKGLSEEEFEKKLDKFGKVRYELDEVEFTHDILNEYGDFVDGGLVMVERVVEGPAWLVDNYEGFVICYMRDFKRRPRLQAVYEPWFRNNGIRLRPREHR